MPGGPGEAIGPGEKGPAPKELSKEFSLLWTLGDLEPIVGGCQKDAGRFLIRRGTCRGLCEPLLRAMSKRASSSDAESSRTWIETCLLLCSPAGSSWPAADAILISNTTVKKFTSYSQHKIFLRKLPPSFFRVSLFVLNYEQVLMLSLRFTLSPLLVQTTHHSK